MIYVITEGAYSDYAIQVLIEGPIGLDVGDIREEIERIYQQLQATLRIRRDEWEMKYPKEAKSYTRIYWSEEAKATYPGYPKTSDAIAEWLLAHSEYYIIEWDEINLYL